MTGTPHFMEIHDPLADADRHLRWVFRNLPGYKALALFNRDTEKMTERFHLKYYTLMADIRKVVESGKPIEVFFAPLPLSTPDRTKFNAQSRWVVWADADHGLTEALKATLRRWGFRIVASGTPGRFHVYAWLTRCLTMAEHRAVQDALCKYVNGDPSVKADNALLRVPDTWNNKNHPNVPEHKRNDQRYPVVVDSWGKRFVDADRLIKDLGVSFDSALSVPAPQMPTFKDVPLPDPLPGVAIMLRREPSGGDGSGRYRRCMAAVSSVMELGFTRDQAHKILDAFDPGVDKYGARWHMQIDHIWSVRMAKDNPKFEVVGNVADGSAVLRKASKQQATVEVWTGETGFWQSRVVLQHIYKYAKANRLSEWALLGSVLVRVVIATPPWVMLPDQGSLNLYLGLVGAPGSGKGRTTRHASMAVEVGSEITPVGLGSGQGIPHLFKKRTKDGAIETVATSVLFVVPEIDAYTALASGTGATLDAELRAAWMGESLGGAYADPSKRLPIAENSYRLGMVMGIQPERAGALLGRAGGGTPQRFLWLPAYDENMPEVRLPNPGTFMLPEREFRLDDSMDVSQTIVAEMDADLVRRNRDNKGGSAMDAHTLFLRLKVAGAFALLDRRLDVTDEDWALAKTVTDLSDRTREGIQQALEQTRRVEDRVEGKRSGRRKLAEADVLHSTGVARCKVRIVTVLKDKASGGWISESDLKRECGRNREYFEDAMRELMAEEKVTRQATEYNGRPGAKYRVKGGQG